MKKLFFAALAATTLFASCAKEGNGPNNVQEGPKTTMGISFTMPKAMGTRAADGDAITATPLENTFTTMHVFIFNSDGTPATNGNGVSRAKADFDEVDGVYTLKAEKQIETTAGAKRIYIGLNLPAGFDSFASEAALKTATSFVATSMVTANGAAMMSGLIEQTLVTQEDNSEIIPANQVTTELERMVAKVAVNTNNTDKKFTSNFDETALNFTVEYEILKWDIGQSTNLMYPTQQLNAAGKLITPRKSDGTPAVGAAPTTLSVNIEGNANATDGNWALMTSTTYVGENVPLNKLVGESTYALVQAKAVPSKSASVVGEVIELNDAPAFTDGTFWVVRSNDGIYFCEDETKANDVALALGDDATLQEYPGGHVYFIVWLNKDITAEMSEKLIVKRNQFIHIEITGVSDNAFGGIPGKGDDGTTPPDPTDPDDPTKPDPEDPVLETPSQLNVVIKVKPWVYVGNSTVLG